MVADYKTINPESFTTNNKSFKQGSSPRMVADYKTVNPESFTTNNKPSKALLEWFQTIKQSTLNLLQQITGC